MSLCQSCNGISLARLIPDLEASQSDNVFLVVQPSIDALRLSAESCKLCALFIQALSLSSDAQSMVCLNQAQNDSPVFLIPGDPYYSNPNVAKRISWLAVHCGPHVSAPLSIFAHLDDPLYQSQDVTGREVCTGPDSLDSLNYLKSLVEDCRRNHPECALRISSEGTSKQTENVPLPTRLLDLDFGSDITGARIRLVRTLGQDGTYVALSHCWGKVPFLTTTSKSLRRRKQGILLSNLPQTFQDAIKITRHFGIRWLWIDSLCIMQDAQKDWHHESSRMGFVYKNAKFTIAATAAENGTVGCFVPRQVSALPPVQLPNLAMGTPRYNKTKRTLKTQSRVYVSLARSSYSTAVSSSPLQQRAWVIQELILSRRILHFAADQTFFECQRSCVGEDGTTHLLNGRLKQSFDLRDYVGAEKQDVNVHEWLSTLPLHRRWSRIVENYTKRGLTKATDKLPALAGLAGEVARRSAGGGEEDNYLAGMWQKGLHMSLLWTACVEGSLGLAESYRAPSWSWASREGQVEWRLDAAMRQQWTTTDMDVVEARTEPEDKDDVYGSVKSGHLVLKCAVKKIRYLNQNQGFDNEGLTLSDFGEGSTALVDEQGIQVGIGWMDGPMGGRLWVEAALISKCEYGLGKTSSGSLGVLLLERIDDHGREPEFRRVGAGSLFTMDFFGMLEKTNIRIT